MGSVVFCDLLRIPRHLQVDRYKLRQLESLNVGVLKPDRQKSQVAGFTNSDP